LVADSSASLELERTAGVSMSLGLGVKSPMREGGVEGIIRERDARRVGGKLGRSGRRRRLSASVSFPFEVPVFAISKQYVRSPLLKIGTIV
jgi:hypothetical protein